MSSYQSKTHSEENYSLEFEETFSYNFSNSEDSGSDLLNQAYIETPPFDELSGKLDFPVDKCDESKLEVQNRHCPTEITREESSDKALKYNNGSLVDKEVDSKKPVSPLISPGIIPKLTLPQHWRRPLGTLLSPYSVLNAGENKYDDHHIKPESPGSQKKSSWSSTDYCSHLSEHPNSTTSFDCDICLAEKENKCDNIRCGEKRYTKHKHEDTDIYNKEFCIADKVSSSECARKLHNNLKPVSSFTSSKDEDSIPDSTIPSSNHEKSNSDINLFVGKQVARINPFSLQEKGGNVVKEKPVQQEEFSSNISSEESRHREDFDSSDSDESTEHSEFDSEVLRQLKFQQVLSRKYAPVNSNQDVNPVTIPFNNIIERGMGVKRHVYHDDLSIIYEVSEGSSRQSRLTSSSSKGSLQGSLQKELDTKSPGRSLDMSPGSFKKISLADSEASEQEKYDSDHYMSVGDSQFNLISPKPSYSTPKPIFLPKTTTHLEGFKRKHLAPPTLHILKSENSGSETSPDVIKPNLPLGKTREEQWEKLLEVGNNDPEAHNINSLYVKDGCSNAQRPLLKPSDVKRNLQQLLDSKVSGDHTKSTSGSTKIDEICDTNHNNLKTSCLPTNSTNVDRPSLKLIKAPDYLKIMSLSISDTMSDLSSLVNSPVKPTLNRAKVVEESLQERGILEEPDLTLVPRGLITIHEETQYKKAPDSPSMMSFLQHEMSCMLSGNDTGNAQLNTVCNIPSTAKTTATLPVKRESFKHSKKFPNVKYQERTKRLWNNLEEVKKKKTAEEIKEAAIANRLKAKEFAKRLTPKKKAR